MPYSRDYKQKYDYFRKKLKKPVSCLQYILKWYRTKYCVDLSFTCGGDRKLPSDQCRLTSQTALRWSWSEMPSWRTRTDASSRWRGRTCWRLDCGWNSRGKRGWTTAVWPGSGSSWCPRRCLTHTTDCLSIRPRESRFHSFYTICLQLSLLTLQRTEEIKVIPTDRPVREKRQ